MLVEGELTACALTGVCPSVHPVYVSLLGSQAALHHVPPASHRVRACDAGTLATVFDLLGSLDACGDQRPIVLRACERCMVTKARVITDHS